MGAPATANLGLWLGGPFVIVGDAWACDLNAQTVEDTITDVYEQITNVYETVNQITLSQLPSLIDAGTF